MGGGGGEGEEPCHRGCIWRAHRLATQTLWSRRRQSAEPQSQEGCRRERRRGVGKDSQVVGERRTCLVTSVLTTRLTADGMLRDTAAGRTGQKGAHARACDGLLSPLSNLLSSSLTVHISCGMTNTSGRGMRGREKGGARGGGEGKAWEGHDGEVDGGRVCEGRRRSLVFSPCRGDALAILKFQTSPGACWMWGPPAAPTSRTAPSRASVACLTPT